MTLDWANENFVKWYRRETADWLALSWDAQALFRALVIKADTSGRVHLGRRGKRAIAIAVGHPGQIKRLLPALEELLADTCVTIEGESTLVVRNYVAAQKTAQSATSRKQAQRAREKVTAGHEVSRDVTAGHAPSQLSPREEKRREEKRRDKKKEDLRAAGAAPPESVEQPAPSQDVTAGPPGPAPSPHVTPSHHTSRDVTPRPTKSRQPDPRHAPLLERLCEAFEANRGAPFPVDGHQAKALSRLLAKGTDAEILECWIRALGSDEFPRVRTLAELDKNWAHFTGIGPPKSSRPSAPPVQALEAGRGGEWEAGTCEACESETRTGCTQHGHFCCGECWGECWETAGALEGEAAVLAFLARKRPAVPEPPFEKVPPPRLKPVPAPDRETAKRPVHVGKRKAVLA